MTLSLLAGRRVLVVEDEMMIAMLIKDILTDHGCTIVGPAFRIPDALRLLADEAVELALLDVNLNGVASYPIAEELGRRNIPFVFATGYGSGGVRDGYGHHAIIQKPFDANELCSALVSAVAAKEAGQSA